MPGAETHAAPTPGASVHDTSAQGVPLHHTAVPVAPASAPGGSAHVEPTPGAETHAAPTPGATAHETSAQGIPPHSAPVQAAPAHSTPAPGTPTQGAPVPGTSAHGAQAHPAGPPGIPAHGAPPQAAQAAPSHGAPAVPPHPTPDPAHPTMAPAQAPVQAPPPDPWRRYDPWRAPLQQAGVAVDAPRRKWRQGLVLGAVLIALVAGGIGGAVGAYLEREGGIGSDVELPQAGAESEKRPKNSVAGIAASSLPGVVTLHVRGDDGAGTGTGFVLDGKGHILTNNHVVEPAGTGGEISVSFSGGETASAKVVGRDAGYDLAVVKVSGVRGLKPLPLGNSENVQVGDPVVAIGAPFDLANTVTSGIISAKERPITAGGEKGDGSDVSYVNALQTDAPINPGNSGGPLVDSKARVIGINSAIRSADRGSELDGGQAGSIGLGFAIPINQGKRVAEELINTGRATHPVIGVTIDKQFTGDGARIARKSQSGGPAVNRGGPGDKAGLKPGDVITAVDGRRVHSGDELIVKIRAHRPKDRLDLTVERDGDERKVTLVLGSASGD
ncbi:trypsin-like peptidase domain-containing protein [Streptomyces sp. NPDC059063]|uniref:S1C family serine protease n=1 Tax=unclassified Streptomyces TaxID=2593676 RepID=UPI003673B490